jgi:hypothetical protein
MLILSSSLFYGNVFNNVSAQSVGYHYSPSLTLSGSSYLDISSKSSLQLSQFTVAAWFKTSKDSVVVEAMTVNKGGVGSESSGENANYQLSMTTSDYDKFGIKKLYTTKSGGEQWFMDMSNPLSDSRFNPQNTITKNPDGSWKMKSTKVRMAVYTSTGYDQNDISTLDHSAIASKGYMLAPNDWRNFEMTQ